MNSIAKGYSIPRIKTRRTNLRGKDYLTPSQVETLLNSETTLIQEKLDGKQTKFQLREFGDRYVFFGEDMKRCHTIFYLELPSFMYVFDVWDNTRNAFLDYFEMFNVVLDAGMIPSNVIGYGSHPSFTDLERMLFDVLTGFKSTKVNPGMKEMILNERNRYDWQHKEFLEFVDRENFIEGVVVKNYQSKLMGKIVNPLFEEMIDICGRYEKYQQTNRLVPFDLEKYTEYVNQIVATIGGSEIPEDLLMNRYTAYLNRLDKF